MRRIDLADVARRNARRGAAVGLGVAGVLLFHFSGVAASARDSFIFMGFDLDRAVLLTGLLGSALAGAVAGLVVDDRLLPAAAGLLGLGALFGRTYLDEAARALHGDVVLGSFNPVGWILTSVALLAAGPLLGLGAGILAAEARKELVPIGMRLVTAWNDRRWREVPGRSVAATILVLVALVVGLPVMGQLLNYGPDSLMWQGGAAPVPIAGQGTSYPVPSIAPSTSPRSNPTASATPAGSLTNAVRPWLAWRPTGAGTVLTETLPAPWAGGSSASATFWVYLPPGYASGNRRYPVVYEIPWAISLYDNGAQIRPTLDALIDGGQIPAEIVVFLTSNGGPFVDNECIDAAGGREWFDTFIGARLVPYIDATFRTIATAAARTLMGDSQGGFCAANVLLHHADLFTQEISFSGYYLAAPLLSMTPSAQAAYAGDGALERANSPMLIAGTISPARRAAIELILVGNPAQTFYGPQMTSFALLARRLGYAVHEIVTSYGHSWNGVRATLPSALIAAALHAAASGAFAGA